jgi:hypothetical protein
MASLGTSSTACREKEELRYWTLSQWAVLRRRPYHDRKKSSHRALIIESRIYGDLQGLTGAFASYAIARRKRLATRKEELRSSLADMGKVVSLLILIALIAPVLVIIPGIGVVAVVPPITCIPIVVLYGSRGWEVAK